MSDSNDTGTVRVRLLARYAGLPLPSERETLVAGILDVWAPAADELSRKMSAAIHQNLFPATVLTHAPDARDEAS